MLQDMIEKHQSCLSNALLHVNQDTLHQYRAIDHLQARSYLRLYLDLDLDVDVDVDVRTCIRMTHDRISIAPSICVFMHTILMMGSWIACCEYICIFEYLLVFVGRQVYEIHIFIFLHIDIVIHIKT